MKTHALGAISKGCGAGGGGSSAGIGCGGGGGGGNAANSSAHGADPAAGFDSAASKFSIITGSENPINSVSCIAPRFLAR